MRKLILRSFYSIITILILLCWLIATESGLKLLTRIINNSSKVQITEISGTLAHSPAAEKIIIYNNSNKITAQGVAFNWNIVKILKGKLSIQSAYTQTIKIETINTQKSSQHSTPPYKDKFIKRLANITVDIKNVEIGDISLKINHEKPNIIANNITGSLILENDKIYAKLNLTNPMGGKMQFLSSGTPENYTINLQIGKYLKLNGYGHNSNIELAITDHQDEFNLQANLLNQNAVLTMNKLSLEKYSKNLNNSIITGKLKIISSTHTTKAYGKINGTWRNNPLNLAFTTDIAADDIKSAGTFTLGTTNYVNWKIKDIKNISTKIHLGNIQEIYPSFKGKIVGNIIIDNNKPAMPISLTSQNLQIGPIAVTNFELSNPTINYLKISAPQIKYLTHTLKQVNIDLDISKKLLRYDATFDNNKTVIELKLANRILSINNLVITNNNNISWTLTKPSLINLKNNEIDITKTCLTSNNTQSLICIKVHSNFKNKHNVNLEINRTNLNHLPFLNEVTNYLKKPEGIINGNLAFTSDKQQTFSGKITLNDGKAFIPQIASNIFFDTEISGQGNKIVIANNITKKANQTSHNLNANIEIDPNNNSGKAKIVANNYIFNNNDDIAITLSGDLTIEHSNKRSNINGNINIVDSLFKPRPIKPMLQLPDDVIILGLHQQKSLIKHDKKILTGKININLGKNVHLEAFGIDSDVKGNIHIYKNPNSEFLANGAIRAISGTYSAYGQNLKIEQATLSYNSQPLTSPDYSVSAIKIISINNSNKEPSYTSNERLVGIKVTGSLTDDKRNIELFARPSNLSQKDILSYIIFGHTLGENDEDSENQVFSFLTNLGLGLYNGSGDNSIINKIQKIFHLDRVELVAKNTPDNQASILENTNIVVSKKLSDRLEMKASRGILDDDFDLDLSYKINPELSLSANTSNKNNGLGLRFYQRGKR